MANLTNQEIDSIVSSVDNADDAYSLAESRWRSLNPNMRGSMPNHPYLHQRISRQFGGGIGGRRGLGLGLGGTVRGLFGSIADTGAELYGAQIGQRTNVENTDVPSDVLKALQSLSSMKGIPFKALGIAKDQIIDQYQQESELLDQINSKTTLTGTLSRDLQNDIKLASINAARYGFTMSEIGDMYVSLVEKSGRFSLINRDTMNMAVPTARAFGLSLTDMAESMTEFEKVGVGAKNTIAAIRDAGLRSVQVGISAKKTAEDLQLNIGKLNQYGFKNGIQGLEKMIRFSKEFRISMDEVFTIADKVMSPEGAMELSANLQVLGGAIGDFNDPLKLMYMATNNVEGLTDALKNAAGGLATYNSEQGRFEITGVNLRRAQEMAKQLGINYKEFANSAVAAAERAQASSQLFAQNIKVDDKQMEFLTNIARMEGGEMKISIPQSVADQLKGELRGQTEIAFSKIDQQTADVLLKNQKAFEKLTTEEMANQQLTVTQQMSRDIAVVASYYKYKAVREINESDFADMLKNAGITEKPAEWRAKTLDNLMKNVAEYKVGEPEPSNLKQEYLTGQSSTTTTSSKTEVTENITYTFKSDPDSDRTRRIWEEELNKNPRDFTKFK
jgi:hypothetical protein